MVYLKLSRLAFLSRINRVIFSACLAVTPSLVLGGGVALIDTPKTPSGDPRLATAGSPKCAPSDHGERMNALLTSTQTADGPVRHYPLATCPRIEAADVAQAIGAAARDGAEAIAVPLRVDLAALYADYPEAMEGSSHTRVVAAYSVADAGRYEPLPDALDAWTYAAGKIGGVKPGAYARVPVERAEVPESVTVDGQSYAFGPSSSAAAVVVAGRWLAD